MGYTSKTVKEILEMERAAQKKMGCSAERWIDVACILDYISLEERDRALFLLRRFQNAAKGEEIRFDRKSYLTLHGMCEIIKRTVFPEEMLRTRRISKEHA